MTKFLHAAAFGVFALLSLSTFAAAPAAADDSPNVKAMQGLYDAFGKGQIETIIDAVSPDVTWEDYGDPAICSCLGPHKGKDGVAAFFKSVGDTWDFSEFKPMTFTSDGDKVLVEGHYTMKSKATGKEVAAHFMHVVTFKDGKVTDFHEYTDTAAMAAALAK